MKLSRTDKKRDQTENITPGSEQRTGWNPEWLGVRFDVVDSYAWHGTVDEISKERSLSRFQFDSTLLSLLPTPVHLPLLEGDDKPECYMISQLTIHTSR